MNTSSRELGLRIPRALSVPALSIVIISAGLVLGLIALSKPILAGAAAAVGLLGLAVATTPDLATVAAIFILYSNVAVVAVRFHGVPKAAGQAVVLLLVVPLVHQLVIRQRKLIVHPVLPLMVLFLAVQVLGMMFSRDVEVSRSAIFEYVLEGMVIFFLVTNVVRTHRALRWATWSLLAAGVVMAAVPIYQQVTHSFDSNFGGFGQATEVGFGTGEVTSQGEVRQPRLSGTIGEQNRFAQNMLMLVPLGLLMASSERLRALRLLALATAGIAGLGCALAFSRGAAVAFVLTVGVMVVMRVVTARQLALVAVATAVLLAAMPQYWTRLATIQQVTSLFSDEAGGVEAADGAIRGRATEMIAAAQVFADHPVIGVGPGMFKHYSRQYGNRLGLRRLEENRQAHSLYLGLAAETGLLGITCFAAMLGVTLYGLLRARARWADERPELANAAAAYFAALVAFMAAGLSMHMAYIRFFYLILGLSAAVTCIAGASAARREARR
ncbi:MAG: O-antigen ligase family protein [Planctomycetota bacterium]|jgi:O-antigen ligase